MTRELTARFFVRLSFIQVIVFDWLLDHYLT